MKGVNIMEGTNLSMEDYEEARKAEEAYYLKEFGMTQKEYEEKITEEIASCTHFERSTATKLYYVCKLCGRRLHVHYSGASINDRMLQHFTLEHRPITKRRIADKLDLTPAIPGGYNA